MNLTVENNSSKFVCHFVNQNESTEKFCGIQYGPGRGCIDLRHTSEKNSTSNSLELGIVLDYQEEQQYCFFATISNGTYTIVLQGLFSVG